MKDKLSKQATALRDEIEKAWRESKGPNPALWKSLQKLNAVLALLETEWPQDEPAPK